MRSLPLIGVTLDSEEAGGWSKLPWYALRRNYFSAIVAAGGLPVALPHHPEMAEAYLAEVDGLVVTGGAFDVDPALWGGGAPHPKVTLKPGRTDFEMAATRAALARDKPVLGICGGQQLLAVALGGQLIQHIPDEVPGALAHEQPNPRTEPGHEVTIAEGTLLSRIIGKPRMAVNSAHHQAVASIGDGGVVNALAPDGVIEGIEHPGYRFALGVQWHPEYAVDPGIRQAGLCHAMQTACHEFVIALAFLPWHASVPCIEAKMSILGNPKLRFLAFKWSIFGLLFINVFFYFTTAEFFEALDSIGWLMLLAIFEYESTTLDKPYDNRFEKFVIWAVQILAYGLIFFSLYMYVTQGMWLYAANASLWVLVTAALLYDMYVPGEFGKTEWRIRNGIKISLYGALCVVAVLWGLNGDVFNFYDAFLWILCFFVVELNVVNFEEQEGAKAATAAKAQETPRIA